MSEVTIGWKMSSNTQKQKQEACKPEKCNVNTTNISNSNSKDNPTVIKKNNSNINYFIPGLSKKLTKEQMQKWHRNYVKSSVIYMLELGVLAALQAMPEGKPYQAMPRCVAYAYINCLERNWSIYDSKTSSHHWALMTQWNGATFLH